jgi:transcriptional regulator with XRE-family HTH domain
MKLKDYKEREKMTQTELAEKIGCNVAYLNQILHGVKKPSWSMMQKIMKATNNKVKPKDFFEKE